MANERIVRCSQCGSEGRILTRTIGYEPGCGHAHMWGERDDGECPICEGSGGEIIDTTPIDMIDLFLLRQEAVPNELPSRHSS